MGYQIPEQPMLIYPSLAARYGLEEALLLGIYHQLAQRMGLRVAGGQCELKLDAQSWRQLVPFWNEQTLGTVTRSLEAQGALNASLSRTLIRILLISEPDSEDMEQTPAPASAQSPDNLVSVAPAVQSVPPVQPPQMMDDEGLSRLEVMDAPPPPPPGRSRQVQPKPAPVPQGARTPAPAFGGSTGWRRGKDELERIFEQHEERNQQMHTMFLGWQPSPTFFELLPRHGIDEAYARGVIDEFVLYWVNRDRRETNWDQKFLAWVKREWVKKQTREGREKRIAQEEAGFKHENSRRDTREKRKRVTQAIMDIRDTDW